MRIRDYIDHIPDSSAISTAQITTAGSAAVGFLSWLGSINWVGLISVLVAVIGLAANIYFMWRRDRRERALMLHKINGGGDCEKT
ncbi:holin [Oligella urethralis]|nr:holin [Oligella urethralis]AVL70875.1 holin [Oligella urethralis]